MGSQSDNLPGDQALFGRAALVSDLEARLSSLRLLTLTGPGGVGKTRVALALAYEREAIWVDLAPLSGDAFVLPAVAAACGLIEQRGPILEALIEALREREALLVLDNCEHVLGACAELCDALLAACPRLRILATSRAPLRIAAEQRVEVPPLDPAAASTLFVHLAAARVPGFALTPASAPLVAQICAQLEGMPLALELAAARLPLLTVAQLAERLTQRLALLAAREPARPSRQRSLRATLDWSCALLGAGEQILLRRLAVFAGSFDLDAVERVCDAPEAIDQLSALVDASLVAIVARDEAGVARYRLHEVTRQYAAELLEAAGETAAYRERHLAWVLQIAEAAAPELEGEQQARWIERLAQERENLRAALLTAEQAGDAERMLRIATALAQLWNVRAISEGRDWLRRGLALAAGQVNQASAAAWNIASFLAYRQEDYPAMRAAAETALRQAHELEAEELIADAHYQLGIFHELRGGLPDARAHYQQSLALYEQLGQQRAVGKVLNGLAHVEKRAGDIAAARGYYERGLALARAVNDRRSAMLLLISLGNMLLDKEDPRSVEPIFVESLAHLRALGETSYLPYVMTGLGEIARFTGDTAAAAAAYEEGLRSAREFALDGMEAQMLVHLGNLAASTGDYERAAPRLSEGLKICLRLGRPERVGVALCFCAKCVQQLGYPAQALTLFAAGLQAVGPEGFAFLGGPDAAACEAAFAAAESALSPAQRDAALAEGRAMALEQAVGLASSAVYLPPRQAAAPELEIYTLGQLRVLRQGREIAAQDWVYGKTRALLLYLLHTDRASKEEIGAALWPDASERQVRQNFRVAIYHLRRALGRPEWIVFASGRYAFNRALDFWHDEAAFSAALAEAAAQPSRRAELLQQAADLYRGDLDLEGLESEALLVRREQLHQQALATLLELGELHLAAGALAPAVETYRRAIALDGYLEQAHRGLMRALAAQGAQSAALAHYQALAAKLQHDLGLAPDAETQALAESIRRSRSPELS